ncbi:putative nuclease HARBI1 [Ruditapes philippinarum]|uniref:putative nuclease HARBI1 n=1 Tax=Ruditapes philippinarum TaxID=129788 RepID=UPI00295B095B|nr:putative nuclease HARBI1 [Ruditapes philippinarum]
MIPYIGKGEICVEKKLLIYVKYISTQQTYQALADIFGVCEYSVHKSIHEISEKICKHLLPDLVKWPEKRTADRTVDGFQEINGFPGVIGAIDGSHIPIRTPTEFPENYIHRKGYPP